MGANICAISTALGIGAIAIIRVSGPESIKIVNSIFKGANLEKVPSHTIHYGFIVDKTNTIDEVLVTVMKSPKTYTKENIVEINTHGGIASTNKVLELLLLSGCRLAEAGEFTKLAFLNGRIDLLEAQSISDLIESKTDNARKLAISGVKGYLSTIIKSARRDILELMANIEVNIDYPEYEDALVITKRLLEDKLTKIQDTLLKILAEAQNGRIIKNGINIAIIGRPNVGKSSILNFLLDEDKAIVTDIAGTTTDTIEGSVILKGILLNLVDTAGIRKVAGKIEKIGIEKSKKALETADLIIYVLANNESITKEDLKTINSIDNNKLIIFINKNDKKAKEDFSSLKKENIVYGNTINNNGLNELKNKIITMFNLEKIETKDFTYLSNARSISLATMALESIEEALKQNIKNSPVDIIAIDIKESFDALGQIIGETYKDELLDELFSKFCLGK